MTSTTRRRPVAASFALLALAGIYASAKCSVTKDPWRELRAAYEASNDRTIRGCISKLKYRPYTRRPNPARRLRIAAERCARECRSEQTRAIAFLLAGKAAKAVKDLAGACRRMTCDAGTWSDLSAAYIELALSTSNPEEYANAIAAADQAIRLESNCAVALFNRAVALHELHFDTAAGRTARRFLAVESEGEWAKEVVLKPRSETRPAQWSGVIPQLEQRSDAGDVAAVIEIVRRFPQECRTWGEGEFAARWAVAERQNDHNASEHWLTVMRMLGTALQKVNGESMLADSADAIDHATPPTRLVLANAYDAYRQARILYKNRRVTEASRELQNSLKLFRQAKTPYTLVVDYYLANAALDRYDVARTLEFVDQQLGAVPAKYKALRASLYWLKATTLGAQARVYDSLLASETAAAEFEALGEKSNASFNRDAVAAAHGLLGNDADAWRAWDSVFRTYSRSGDDRSLQIAITASAYHEALRSHWAAAHALFNAAIETDVAGSNRDLIARVLVWRALAALRISKTDADRELSIARSAAVTVDDTEMRTGVLNELNGAFAMLTDSPEERLRLLSQTIAFFRKHEALAVHPETLVARGRTFLAAGRLGEAEDDFREAVTIIECRREGIGDQSLRDSYFGTVGDAYSCLIDALDRRGAVIEAANVAERANGRALLDISATTRPLSLAELQPKLRDTTIYEYVALDDRLLIFVIERTEIQRFTAPVSRAEIERLSADLVASLRRREFNQQVAAALYEACFSIAAERHDHVRLVLIPDRSMSGIPFGALYDRATRQFLIERTAMTIAPSVNVLVRLQGPRTTVGRTVIVANPTGNALSDVPLRAAAREGREIAAMYHEPLLLTGHAATKAAFLSALTDAGTVHFATHAVVSNVSPAASALLLDDGSLCISDILKCRLQHLDTVVLAGCRTAEQASGYGDLRSLATAFLAAGAHNVVGTLWNLDDEAGMALSCEFHRQIRRGVPPARALQSAQLALRASRDPHLSQPFAWACVELFGRGD